MAQDPALDLAGLREALRQRLATGYTNAWGKGLMTTFTNPYTGAVMIEEDSPGNYRLRERDGQWEFVACDRWGGEYINAIERPGMAERED